MSQESTHSPKISFRPLEEKYFPLIHMWFNSLHVQAFYSLRSWTEEEVRKKLTPYTHGIGGMKSYVIYLNNIPIGYIQSYPVKDHPWDNQGLPEEIVQEAAGFDVFIGEEKYLGKKLGSQIVDAFLKTHIWPHYQYCLVDPDVRNIASMHLFKRCGFKKHKLINSKDAMQRPVTLQLFIRKNELKDLI